MGEDGNWESRIQNASQTFHMPMELSVRPFPPMRRLVRAVIKVGVKSRSRTDFRLTDRTFGTPKSRQLPLFLSHRQDAVVKTSPEARVLYDLHYS